jgi:hypothetical protein
MKIYVNNLLVQIDASATSSYTPTYTNIAIYFISTAYTTTTMHTHTSFSNYFRWSTILSILSLITATSGTSWIAVGGEGTTWLLGGICSLNCTQSRTQPWIKLKHACISKDAYRKVGALIEHAVKVILCGCSVTVGEDMAIRAIHSPSARDSHCSVVWALRHGCCLRGATRRERNTEWMATFVWHQAPKFGGKRWRKNNPASNGCLLTSPGPLIRTIKVE